MTDIAAVVAGNLDIWTGAIQRKSSAGRGGGKRISLYGIERLRVLILDLAVRGKLVAGELAVKQGSLGQVGDWVGGNGFPKQFQGNSEGEIPFLKVSDMNLPGNERLITVSNNYVSADELRAMRAKTHPAGTIIFPKIGGAIATNKRRILGAPSAIDNNCAGQVPRKGIHVDWLYMVLSSIDMAAYQSGTSVPALNMKRLAQHQIAIPKEAEQRRIVAKVDELMALCDALERESADAMAAHQALVEELLDTLVISAGAADLATNWARLESHFDTLFTTDASIEALKQTILDLAVRGKLMEQDAGDEAALELIKELNRGVTSMQKAGLISNRKIVEFPREWTPAFSLPNSWVWECFGNYAAELATGPFGTMIHQSDYVTGGLPLINPSHMIGDRIIEDESISLPPSKVIKLSSYTLKAGDIVFARRGEVGRLALVTDREDGWLCGTGSFRARFSSHSVQPFLALFFRSRYAREFLGGESVGATMSNLNHSILNRLPIPIPPLAEQSRIVAKVDALMKLCDALKTRLAEAAQTQRHLADAITERAAA